MKFLSFNNKQLLLFFFVLVLFTQNACKKEEPPVKDNVPEVIFIQFNKTEVKEFTDKVVISISYGDRDGDLGSNDAGTYNCFVKDSRNGVEYKFRIKQLAPTDAGVHIYGKLDLEIPNTHILDGSSSQKVQYTIYVEDRAGNKSDEVTTTELTVIK